MTLKIGVENFRVFRTMTDFEIRPLTLLIGPNNSGKSSFTKLLLLLKNGIRKLDFSKGEHALVSFSDMLPWDAENKEMTLKIPNGIEWLNNDFFVQITSGKEKSVEIKDYQDEILLSIKRPRIISKGTTGNIKALLEHINNGTIEYETSEEFVLKINIDLIIKMIYEKRLTYYTDEGLIGGFKSFIEESFNNSDIDLSSVNYSNIFEKNNKQNYLSFKHYRNIEAAILSNEIDSLNRDGLLYQLFIDDIEVTTDSFNEDIRTLQTSIFNNFLLKDILKNPEMLRGDYLIDTLEESIPQINQCVKKLIKEYFVNELKVNEEQVEIRETHLGKFIFNSYNLPKVVSYHDDVYYNFFEQLKNVFNNFLFDEINYIGANRGRKQQLLYDKDNDETNKIYAQFFEEFQNRGDQEAYKEYLNEALSILGIKGKIVIDRSTGITTSVFVQFDDISKGNNGKVALNNLGFGFSQIIPLLLKILVLRDGNSRMGDYTLDDSACFGSAATLIIEEPEANLHPLLQSKLADFFILTLKYFPHIRLVVETHSEYLIRRLQILAAQKAIENNKIIIHYFNSDENVSSYEPKVKKIEIDSSGQLTDTFGPGFFDEATNLKYELMKFNANIRKN